MRRNPTQAAGEPDRATALRREWWRIATADAVCVEGATLPAGRFAERARNAALAALEAEADAIADAADTRGC